MKWFATPALPLMVFYAIALVASFILVVQVVLMLFGLGDDLDGDMEDLGDPDGFHILSLRSLTGFFGGFGWMGALVMGSGGSLIVAIVSGGTVGVVLMFSVAYFMTLLYSFRESGNIDFKDAIGQIGTVYISVPPHQSGIGKVRVMFDGRLNVVQACTESGETLVGGKKVRIVSQLDPPYADGGTPG